MGASHAKIREFLGRGEGAPPPVFVGRGTVLADILETAKRSAGLPKMTRIVQGAPGAGKSSILAELERRRTGRDGAPRVVVLSSSDLMADIPAVVNAVVAAGTLPEAGWRDIIRRRAGRTAGLGAFGFSYSRFERPPPASLTAAAGEHDGQTWPPVIVAVDEAQRLPPDPASPAATFLQSIHDGNELPLLLVLAGLSDTAALAGRMQLTRGLEVHDVGALAPAEARDLMERLASRFGLDAPRCLPELHRLAGESGGWPRHLYFAAVAMAEAVRATDAAPLRMDWEGVAARAEASRRAYYGAQYSPEMRGSKFLVAKVMRDLPEGGDVVDVMALVEDSVADGTGWRLPKGMDEKDFLDHLVHQGALYDGRWRGFHSPIPSFRSHLVRAGSMDRAPERNPDPSPPPIPAPGTDDVTGM